MVREAIRRFIQDQRDYPTIDGTDYTIDGYTVLVDNYKMPARQFNIGLYRPGSHPEGTCDGYYICGEDGETIADE